MSFDILGEFGSTAALFDTAAIRGGDQSYTVPSWPGTVDLNASDVSTQVAADGPGQFGAFWSSVGQNLLGYAIARDAVKNGVITRPGGAVQTSGTTPRNGATTVQRPIPPVFLLAGLGVALYLIVHKA